MERISNGGTSKPGNQAPYTLLAFGQYADIVRKLSVHQAWCLAIMARNSIFGGNPSTSGVYPAIVPVVLLGEYKEIYAGVYS